jgi:hypothetical protein
MTREDTHGYPTDFSAISVDYIDRLSRRGEQLTRALIAEHSSYLICGTFCLAPGISKAARRKLSIVQMGSPALGGEA